MRWLLYNMRVRLLAMLLLGVVIGSLGRERLSANVAVGREEKSLGHATHRNKATKKPASLHKRSECPRARSLVLLVDVKTRDLRGRLVSLRAGLTLNFGGCTKNGTVLGYTRNRRLGGSRARPRFFVFSTDHVALR